MSHGLKAGGEVWMGDETRRREFPPLRGAWARVGQHAQVVVSGRNVQRVLLGAVNSLSGRFVQLIRARCRTDDAQAFVEHLGTEQPGIRKLVIWDNAPPTTRAWYVKRPKRSASPSRTCRFGRPN